MRCYTLFEKVFLSVFQINPSGTNEAFLFSKPQKCYCSLKTKGFSAFSYPLDQKHPSYKSIILL